MTNIIELARQAGALVCKEVTSGSRFVELSQVALERFAELIRADERAALDATEPTVPDNMQDWKGMDGTIAWHLIEHHADNWADIGKMMGEWLVANQTALDAPTVKQTLTVQEQSIELDAGMAAQNYCRKLWGAARGHSDWRKFHDAFVAGYIEASTTEPLTDARVDEIMKPLTQNVPYSWREFARAIEQEVRGR